MIALVFATAWAALPAAPPMKAEVPIYAPPMNILCWPSGFQVVAVREEGAPYVAVTMIIDGGDGAEDPKARGAAHLLEHLWFRSTPGGRTSVWDNSAGLQITGSTRLDSTVYATIGAGSDLQALLALEGQRLVDPLVGITPTVFASEKEVVLSELIYRGGDTMDVGMRLLEESLYPEGHPYHGSRVTRASIEALTLEHVRAYAAKQYRPAKASLRIEGNVPVETRALADLLQKALPDAVVAGTGASCLRPADPNVPPKPATTDTLVGEAPVWNQRLLLGWTLPPGYDTEIDVMYYAADLVEAMLEERLWWVAGLGGNERDLAGAGCWIRPGRVASDLVCRLDMPEGVDPAAAVRLAREGLTTLWATGADYDVFVRDRTAWVWASAMREATGLSFDPIETRALWSHFSDEHEVFGARMAGHGVNGDDLVAFGRKWLGADRMASALLRPTDSGDARPSSAATWTPKLDAPAPRWAAVSADVGTVGSSVLDSGLAVWTVRGGPDAPGFVETQFMLRGGSLTAPAAGTQEAFEAMASWTPPIDLDDFHYETATLWWTSFGDRLTSTGSWGSVGSLDAQLWPTRLFLEKVELDSSRRQMALDDQTEMFKNSEHALAYALAVPWAIGDWQRREHLLGTATGGLPWWERNRAARAVRVPDVRAWQDALMRPDNAVLIVSGAIDPAAVAASADKYLGGWRGEGGDPTAPPPAAAPAPAPRVEVIPLARSLTEVAVSCRVPARTPANDPALEVLGDVLARGMWQTLREDGRTYTPDVWVEAAGEVALLHLEAEVMPGEGAPAAKALLGLLRLVAEGKVESAVAAAKVEAGSDFAIDLADTSWAVDRLAMTYASGGTLDDLRAWPSRLATVDAATVARLLDGCVGHEAVTVIGSDDTAGFSSVGPTIEVLDALDLARHLAERMD